MLGTVEKITHDEGLVRLVEVRLPFRGSSTGQLLSLHLFERLGQGSFGSVYRACCDGYPHLALKIATGKSARLREELAVLSKVCTKGKLLLPRFEFGAINKAGDLIAVGMELCVPCTLHDVLLSTRLTNEADMLFIAHQVVQAVAYVHEHQCIHRDIKLQNFVFDLDGNLKLIDFGLASTNWNPPAGDVVAGTVSFMAPEMAHNALYRDKRVSVGAPADVWSVGIVLYSIFMQRNPYPPVTATGYTSCTRHTGKSEEAVSGAAANHNNNATGVSNSLAKENVELLHRVAAGEWSWPTGCVVSSLIRGLIDFILVRDPEKRPDIFAILARTEWCSRRRSPPTAITVYLGVHDDFLLSHDEAHLLRAVKQRSANVTASLMEGHVDVLTGDETEEGRRSSLKFVAKEELTVGGVPTHQVYDVRGERRGKKPIRELSVVISEEIANSQRHKRSKSARDGSASTSRATSRALSRARGAVVDPSRAELSPVRPLISTPHVACDAGGAATFSSGPTTEECTLRNHGGELLLVGDVAVEGGGREDAVVTENQPRSRSCGEVDINSGTVDERVCGSLPTPREVMNLATEYRAKGRSKSSVRSRSASGPTTHKVSASHIPQAPEVIFYVLETVKTESDIREVVESLLLTQHECVVRGIQLVMEEMTERGNMQWLEKEQRKSAPHPHRFKGTLGSVKKYRYGFVCDMCDYDYLPDGSTLYFFHCTCGRDMCVDCHKTYAESCRCRVCGQILPNKISLREHQASKNCVESSTPPSKAPGASANQRSLMAGSKRPRRVTPKRVSAANDRKRKAAAMPAAVPVSATRKRSTQAGGRNQLENETPSFNFTKSIDTLPAEQWKPMERLSVGYRPVQPTTEEREALLNGDWIRHYHLFSPTNDGTDPVALAYHIQPGRTGAIFLKQDFDMHSSVLSILERKIFIVDCMGETTSEDTVRIMSLAQAKCVAERAYNFLQGVVAHDYNMIKQHRAPGFMSVYRTPQTAVRCHGDPFVYVRWFRFDTASLMNAFLLSNGAMQVFVGAEYEVRWFDEERKFIVRSNGMCELVDESTFALHAEMNRLLYEEA